MHGSWAFGACSSLSDVTIPRRLENLALEVRRSGKDRKWDELSALLQNNEEMFDAHGHRRKMILFTEHRDTLNYLAEKLRALLGQPEAVVVIHGTVSSCCQPRRADRLA